ncbi:SOUL heme-binding protein [Seminavis robusta]|uniref:SOUL heme-binding protein n=1 Tax=Seminavis robusta TaxID=568900 RepID=A0A9N8E970_9STRA|nr:SOUL heme-binding protein [Seminavis robusta]|eukprot:Sro686_g187120.1 SOUL heme-binding protein (236) ;mRNA; f:38538-39245
MIPALAARITVGIFAALGTLRFGTGIYFWRVTEALERPTYTVVEKLDNGVEIRQYEPYLIAETTVDGVGFKKPTSDGFRACAGYIFGKNKPQGASWFASKGAEPEPEKMAMTAPVRVSGGASSSSSESITMKKTKVSFVIGTKYSLKTVPTPLDNKVNIRQVPGHTLAVRTFSGPPPADARVEKERAKIETALAKAGRQVPGASEETLVYGYHDPFITPNFLRRNEVALVVEGSV